MYEKFVVSGNMLRLIERNNYLIGENIVKKNNNWNLDYVK